MNLYLKLFLTFAQIGACTYGGGYAMLPILQREIVEKHGWATDAELTDYFAIGQCTPGIIAVNVATFIGHKLTGIVGGIIATLGVVFPSAVIIMVIAAFLQNFADLPIVIHAFGGVRACVCALILSSVLKLRKSSLIDGPTWCIFTLVFGLSLLGNFLPKGIIPTGMEPVWDFVTSPIFLVLLAGLCGFCVKAVKGEVRK